VNYKQLLQTKSQHIASTLTHNASKMTQAAWYSINGHRWQRKLLHITTVVSRTTG